MIFTKYKTIFIHIPRTGGTSVEQMFDSTPRDPYVMNRARLWGWDPQGGFYLQHATAEATLEIVGREVFNKWYKFATVRNPFSRIVSAYYYDLVATQKRFGDFKGYLRALPKLIEEQGKRSSHETPQHRFTHIDGKRVVDTLLRFEELPDAVDVVRTRLRIAQPLPHVNKTDYTEVRQRPTVEHYDAEMVAMVRRVYAEDFELFGYPDTPPGIPPAASGR